MQITHAPRTKAAPFSRPQARKCFRHFKPAAATLESRIYYYIVVERDDGCEADGEDEEPMRERAASVSRFAPYGLHSAEICVFRY